MGAYTLGILPLIKFLLNFINLNKINADDFSVAGNLNSIKDYWDKLTAIGPKYGYFPKPTKSYLIVKEKKLMEAQNLFANSRVKPQRQKKHFGAVIGSIEYRDEYVKYLVKDWDKQITILSTIAETQPQIAYLPFASARKSKLNYFLGNFRHLLLPLERKI